jgi:hypothetical protein
LQRKQGDIEMIIDLTFEMDISTFAAVYQNTKDASGVYVFDYDPCCYTILPSVEIEIPYIPQIGSQIILAEDKYELLTKKFVDSGLVPFIKDTDIWGFYHDLIYDLATTEDNDDREFVLENFNNADDIFQATVVSQVLYNERSKKILITLCSYENKDIEEHKYYLGDSSATKKYLEFLKDIKHKKDLNNQKTDSLNTRIQ